MDGYAGSPAAPPDSQLWQLVALCAGTGGSLLVIGSAAGVAFMGVEGVTFGAHVSLFFCVCRVHGGQGGAQLPSLPDRFLSPLPRPPKKHTTHNNKKGWYLRRVSPWAALGYVGALGLYIALHGLPSAVAVAGG